MAKPTNRVTIPNSIKLTKQYVLIYNSNLEIELQIDNNVETFPRFGSLYQEFDTIEEMEEFVNVNSLSVLPEASKGVGIDELE